jgi:hypothetical protein
MQYGVFCHQGMNINLKFSSKLRMNLRRWGIITLLTVSGATASYAGDVGTSAAQFLELGVGPRALAMGDAQVGLANDVYATYWNPAGLARLESQEAGFFANQYLQNITEEYAAYAYPHPKLGTFAGSVTYFNVGQFQGYDAGGAPNGNVGASDAAFGFSYAHSLLHDPRLGSDISLGFTGKYIQERLDTVTARAFATDLGVLFKPGLQWAGLLEGWKAGLAIRNIGSALKYDAESFPLPRRLDAGLSYTGHILGEDFTWAIDGRKPQNGKQSLGTGLEVWALQSFALRIGYSNQGDLGNGLRMGAGIKFKTIQVDYAFAPAGNLGNVNYVSLTLRFKPPQPDPRYLSQKRYEKGMKEFKQRHYTDALVDFNKSLELDASHPEALRMMKKTYEQIKVIAPE